MTDTKFTVSMHPTLVDGLDEGFSPMDGIAAIDEIFSELPLVHPGSVPEHERRTADRTLKLYHGCYDWYREVGFNYVQIGTTLHVLDIWFDQSPNLSNMDVILGTGRTAGYEPLGQS
ncbi:MAG: hypothetical protein JSS02_31120 [Planctomycetes bacterium]|nr:hypothetical protein [Planctomycetota bacterium]